MKKGLVVGIIIIFLAVLGLLFVVQGDNLAVILSEQEPTTETSEQGRDTSALVNATLVVRSVQHIDEDIRISLLRLEAPGYVAVINDEGEVIVTSEVFGEGMYQQVVLSTAGLLEAEQEYQLVAYEDLGRLGIVDEEDKVVITERGREVKKPIIVTADDSFLFNLGEPNTNTGDQDEDIVDREISEEQV